MSLLIPASLGQVWTPAGPAAAAFDLGLDSGGLPADRYLQYSDALFTAGPNMTVVTFFETPSTAIATAGHKYIIGCSHWSLRFQAYDARLQLLFYNTAFTPVWTAYSVATFSPSTKYCVAVSISAGGTRQLYINGQIASTQTDVTTAVGDNISRNRITLIGMYSAAYHKIRLGPMWLDDTAQDLSSVMGNYVTGGTTPVDAANGCLAYYDMADYANGGSSGVALTAPDGDPFSDTW